MMTIPQCELTSRFDEILRQAEADEQFTITVEGRPVAVLGPIPKRQWVSREEALRVLRSQPPDPHFFEDIRDLLK